VETRVIDTFLVAGKTGGRTTGLAQTGDPASALLFTLLLAAVGGLVVIISGSGRIRELAHAIRRRPAAKP